MARPLDEYNDTVDKVILVQRIAQSPKAIIALLAENRRLARRVAKLEKMIVAVCYHAGCGPWPRTCIQLNAVRAEAARIFARRTKKAGR